MAVSDKLFEHRATGSWAGSGAAHSSGPVPSASRRPYTCELILEVAGGTLAAGLIDVGRQPPPRAPVVLRLSQIRRVLGIEVDRPAGDRADSPKGDHPQAPQKA